VDPNIDIREGYVNYKIVKDHGGILTGTITDRSSEMVTLKSFGGEETIIPTDQIQEMEALPTSLMPERLTDNLTDQEIRDLFSYIMKNTNDPGI
jgi:putative heme-binding domain-containing protein